MLCDCDNTEGTSRKTSYPFSLNTNTDQESSRCLLITIVAEYVHAVVMLCGMACRFITLRVLTLQTLGAQLLKRGVDPQVIHTKPKRLRTSVTEDLLRS
jgi:hypothetical protein